MASNLPPIRSPMYVNGTMTQPWSTFFTRLLIQSGSTSTSSGVDDLTPINFTDSLSVEDDTNTLASLDQFNYKIAELEGVLIGLSNRNYELEKIIESLNVSPRLGFIPVNVMGDKMHGTLTMFKGEAGRPPIFMQVGTLTTSPLEGAVEFDGDSFYFCHHDGVRNAAVLSNGAITSTATVSNTVTETTVYSRTFAADELVQYERIEFDISGAYSNASASDDFTINFKLGGSTFATVARAGGNVTDAGWIASARLSVRSTGASGTYVHWAEFDDGTTNYAVADITPHAIDTTTTNLFEVTVTWDAAKAGNTFSSTQGGLTFKH